MKCPECQKEGNTSLVYPGMSTTTDMYYQPYYDEQGNYHDNDNNSVTTEYTCSNGHTWKESA